MPEWHCAMRQYHILGSHIVCFISRQNKLKLSALSITGEKVTPKYDMAALPSAILVTSLVIRVKEFSKLIHWVLKESTNTF